MEEDESKVDEAKAPPVHTENTRMAKIMEKKRKLKEAFDAEFDQEKTIGKKSYHDLLKDDAEAQGQANRSEFVGLDDEQRIRYEGFRPGLYVRIQINKVPMELVLNFDPTYPYLIGGLLSQEQNIGFVQVRLKKHRWYPRILKNRDPMIVSLGWRRFQTLPVYSTQDHNMRNRMLKYTPQHMHCLASFWGPITPQGSGEKSFIA